MKIEDIYVDMAENVQTRFDTSNYEKGKPLPKGRKYFGGSFTHWDQKCVAI